MRTIKFRGYDKIADGWCIGTPVKDKDVKGRFWIMFNEVDGSIIDDPKTIGQYTGLKDKNGTEIYEGDILKGGIFKEYEVKWDGENTTFNLSEYGVSQSFEVIGNIHQNKELIKTK